MRVTYRKLHLTHVFIKCIYASTQERNLIRDKYEFLRTCCDVFRRRAQINSKLIFDVNTK